MRGVSKKLEEADVCRLWKWPTERRILGGGEFTYAEKTGCDFFGYTGAGIVMMIEVKETVDPKKRRVKLRPNQVEALRACHKAGGLAIVIGVTGEKFNYHVYTPRIDYVDLKPGVLIPVEHMFGELKAAIELFTRIRDSGAR